MQSLQTDPLTDNQIPHGIYRSTGIADDPPHRPSGGGAAATRKPPVDSVAAAIVSLADNHGPERLFEAITARAAKSPSPHCDSLQARVQFLETVIEADQIAMRAAAELLDAHGQGQGASRILRQRAAFLSDLGFGKPAVAGGKAA